MPFAQAYQSSTFGKIQAFEFLTTLNMTAPD
jgi:hypothetical protein